jgi:hypothetical protein
MSDNLKIYNSVRTVPQEAQKPIAGGRLRGKTDINPMWRIKALTEQFGACGFGWYAEITEHWLENGASNEIACFVRINLYVKVDGEWSKPIAGVGGNLFVESELKGLHTSDECYKMAYTDAISVACKALGFGADVYWEKDKSKYDAAPQPKTQQSTPPPTTTTPKTNGISEAQRKMLYARATTVGLTMEQLKIITADMHEAKKISSPSSKDWTRKDFDAVLKVVDEWKTEVSNG